MSTLGQTSSRGRAQATLVVLLLIVPLAFSIMTGAYMAHPDARTGAPGEGTCQSCHDNYGLNSGSGSIMVMGMPMATTPQRQTKKNKCILIK